VSVISPPKYVVSVLLCLESHGFRAYLVGGCVRDCIMGRRPNDWDICTSALPSEVMEVFHNSRPTGLKHGTVTVIEHGSSVEITTFRTDGVYLDHRRPENVRFVSDLTADLERRDFTINAIALPLSGIAFDPFGGMADIENKLIRCVGDPDRRFNEDALRMLRAVRFSATLGFEIEEQTMAAIRKNAYLAKSLAAERVCTEVEKILLSKTPQKIEELIRSGLLSEYVYANKNVTDLSPIALIPKNRFQRWAALCVLLRLGGLIDNSEEFLLKLRLDSATVHNASRGCELALSGIPQTRLEWKRLLAKNGTDCGKCTAAAAEVMDGENNIRQLQSIISCGDCYSLKRLNISGDDLLELGFSGPKLGWALDTLLDYILEHPAENVRPLLLERARQLL